MKRNKIFTSIILPTTALSAITPICLLTSCSKTKKIPFDAFIIEPYEGGSVLYGLKEEYLKSGKLDKYNAIEIPAEVEYIAPDAFARPSIGGYYSLLSRNIKKLMFAKNSKCHYIGDHAFAYSHIQSVKFPKTQYSIQIRDHAFTQSHLTNIDFSEYSYDKLLNTIQYIAETAFSFLPSEGKIVYSGNFTSEQIKAIDLKMFAQTLIPYSFYGREIKVEKALYNVDSNNILLGFNSSLNETEQKVLIKLDGFHLMIPSNVVSVKANAFYHESLTKPLVPDYVTTIDFSLAPNCSVIEKQAFYQSKAYAIILPQQIQALGINCFGSMSNLSTIDVSLAKASNFASATISDQWMTGHAEQGIIITELKDNEDEQIKENANWWRVLSATTNLVLDEAWWDFLYREETPRNLFYANPAAGSSTATLKGFKKDYLTQNRVLNDVGTYLAGTNLIIPGYSYDLNDPTYQTRFYTEVEDYAFFFNEITQFPTSIKSLTFGDATIISRIGKYAFYDASFESINLPISLKEIGTKAFGSETSSPITYLSIPSNCSKIDPSAFNNVKELRYLDLSDWELSPNFEDASHGNDWSKTAFTSLDKTVPTEGGRTNYIIVSKALKANATELTKLTTGLTTLGFENWKIIEA